jgi:hypothetical protein
MVISEALLVMLISVDPAWAILEYIELFFLNVWLSQEKIF